MDTVNVPLSSLSISEVSRAESAYKQCVKLFLNKKFSKCYTLSHELYKESTSLYSSGKISSDLFEQVANLYITMLGLIVSQNSRLQIVPHKCGNTIRDQFSEDLMLNDLIRVCSNSLLNIPIGIVYNILLISFSNDLVSLADLKKKIESYFALTNYGIYQEFNDDEIENFNKMIQLYVLNVLPNLKLNELAEEFIMTNPYIEDKTEYVGLLSDSILKVKEKEINKVKIEQARKAKEEKLRKQREEEEKKIKEEQNYQAMLLRRAKEQSARIVSTETSKETITTFDIFALKSYMSLINKVLTLEFLKEKSGYVFLLMLAITLLRKLLTMKKRRDFSQILKLFLAKLKSTISMAFKVSYL